MTVEPEQAVRLSATVRDALGVAKTTFYCGDRPLGEAAAPPWAVTWEEPPHGPNAVFVEWQTTDGKRGVSNPALIIVRHRPSRPKPAREDKR